MKIMKASEARRNFLEMLNEVYYTKKSIIVTKNGKPRIVIRAVTDDDMKKQKKIK